MAKKLDADRERHVTEPRAVIPGYDLRFRWHDGSWEKIFDKQIELIQDDIKRVRAEDKLVVYLSCPISSRGGSYHGTNVDIAKHTERRLLQRWGERFWILNPAQYQLESKAGTGLITRHAKEAGIALDELEAYSKPGGGDYMRMWMTVLVHDDDGSEDPAEGRPDPRLKDTGQRFDAFYFLGPSDVHDFFTLGREQTLSAGVEEYFARRFATDPDFRDFFSLEGLEWRRGWADDKGLSQAEKKAQTGLRQTWEELRKQFVNFYTLRASVNFSLGSHDEWNIFQQINSKRRKALVSAEMPNGDPGIQLAGFFDGVQIDPASTETAVSRGYAV